MAFPAGKLEKPKRSLGVARLARETLNDKVYNELKRAIMSGGLMPGTSFTIRALSDAMGISAMPVREALRRLVAERALEILPNRSAALPVLTPAQFDEIRRIRISFEGVATEKAADQMTAADIERLRRIQGDMSSHKPISPAVYLQRNQQFHFAIYQASRMAVLLPFIESLWLRIGPLLHYSITIGFDKVHVNHFAAIEAIEARNPKAARAAIEADINLSAEVILDLMQRHPAPRV